jgi:DNA end-binding protein Ku
MRSILNATLQFGLVAIPVGIVPAWTDRPGFRRLHRDCATPVNEPAWCPVHERVLEDEEIVSGFEVASGQFVELEPAELEALAPTATSAIEIVCLLDADRVDPVRVEKTYYLAGAKTHRGRKPYVLLHRLLVARSNVAIARLVFKGREWLVAIAPHPGRNVLLLQKLVYTEQLADPTELEVDLRDAELQDGEVAAGDKLAGRLWQKTAKAALFEDHHRARVRALVDAKLAGGEIVAAATSNRTPVVLPNVDLEEQLRASLRSTPTRKKAKPRAASATRRSQ